MSDVEWYTDYPARRVVLLGASNLIRGISPVVGLSQQVWGSPLDILAALGHGRSYGLTETRVLGRGLPGILRCGIWKALNGRPKVPTASLLTDIGNDVLYGVSVPQIAAWVEQCLRRLSDHSERIVVTELPLASITQLQRWKFLMMRSMFYPRSQLRFEEGVRRSHELNQVVLELARQYRAMNVKPCTTWYGFDPIHIRRRFGPQAWRVILSAWREDRRSETFTPSIRRWMLLRCLRPEERRLFGVVQRRNQPGGKMLDGSYVSFY